MFFIFLALQVLTPVPRADPFEFFRPTATITAEDRGQLDRGHPITRILPGSGSEVAVLTAVPVNIDGDRLVAWMRRIEALKKSAYVLAIGRFSDPPRMEDLADLILDDEELSEIQTCRPGSCGLKMSLGEMTQLRKAADGAERDGNRAIQNAFRRVLLERVQTYLAKGDLAHGDQQSHVGPARRFASILDHSAYLTEHLPRFVEHLRGYPVTAAPGVESFVYWSKERLAGKAIISITHVSILRGQDPSLPDVLVAGKEFFATRYVNASLGVTALVRGDSGRSNYLVYLNRSDVDMLRGMFGGLTRWVLQRRLKQDATNVLQGLRRRLESGEPPPAGASDAR